MSYTLSLLGMFYWFSLQNDFSFLSIESSPKFPNLYGLSFFNPSRDKLEFLFLNTISWKENMTGHISLVSKSGPTTPDRWHQEYGY